MSNTKPRFYIDTMVLVYASKPRHDSSRHMIAKNFLKRIEQGTYEGVVSTLTLSEFAKVIRQIMVEREKIYSAQDWEKDFKKAVEEIFKMANITLHSDFKKGDETLLTVKELGAEGLRIMEQYRGHVVHGEHDGIHSMDAYHIVIAKTIGCLKIATFDNDFDETRSEIEPLKLQSDYF